MRPAVSFLKPTNSPASSCKNSQTSSFSEWISEWKCAPEARCPGGRTSWQTSNDRMPAKSYRDRATPRGSTVLPAVNGRPRRALSRSSPEPLAVGPGDNLTRSRILAGVPEFVFNAFVTLVVVVDPLGLAPIFVALTKGYGPERKRATAVRGTLLGGAILLVFALAGGVLLGALGIGIPAFRIAGGVLLFLLALDMIFASPTGMRSKSVREQEEASYENDVAVFPLAIPLLAGPGAITTVLLYAGGRGAGETAVLVGVLAAVLLLALAAMLLATRVMELFGETGANVLSRVLGVLLAALAVQFVLDGVTASLA